MVRPKISKRQRQKGQAIVEFALLAPVLFFLLLGVFDFGLYAYAFVSVQNAARVASLRNSGGVDGPSDQTGACSLVAEELRGLPNVGSAYTGSCNASPIVVTSQMCQGTAACAGFTGSADGQPATVVSVSYTMPGVFQFPFVGPSTVTRKSEMRIRSVE